MTTTCQKKVHIILPDEYKSKLYIVDPSVREKKEKRAAIYFLKKAFMIYYGKNSFHYRIYAKNASFKEMLIMLLEEFNDKLLYSQVESTKNEKEKAEIIWAYTIYHFM